MEERWEEKGGEDRKGRGEGIDKKRVPPGYNLVMGSRLKRQKAPREARWRDFAMYLERLSRRETLPVKREKLRDLYDKWRFPFEYKATFATMLRALERHKQISIEGAGNDVICYSDHMAKGSAARGAASGADKNGPRAYCSAAEEAGGGRCDPKDRARAAENQVRDTLMLVQLS